MNMIGTAMMRPFIFTHIFIYKAFDAPIAIWDPYSVTTAHYYSSLTRSRTHTGYEHILIALFVGFQEVCAQNLNKRYGVDSPFAVFHAHPKL
eukprot:6192000-Pleurochrysis_carterae.AAC.3